MAECIKDGSLYNDGEDDQDEPELSVGDTLEGYNRQALMTIIGLNKLPITVMKKWTDGQVRQAIRDIVADVSKLMVQPARTGEMDAANLSPLQ